MFLLKTQTLYLCFLVAAFLLATNAIYISMLFKPHDVLFDKDGKYLALEVPMNYLLAAWAILYVTTNLQLAMSWLYLGTASSLSSDLRSYFAFRIKLVRVFQFLIPVTLFTTIYISGNPYSIALVVPFTYVILAGYLYSGRKVLTDRLANVNDRELLRQADLVKQCFVRLTFSVTILLIQSIPMAAIFLFDEWPLFLAKMLFPKPGGIQLFLIPWQMARDLTGLLAIKDILLYFDRALQSSAANPNQSLSTYF